MNNLKFSETTPKAELVKMFEDAYAFLEPVFKIYLSRESYTIQRLMYNLNNQQRHWKWYHLIGKIQKCVTRAEAINLHQNFKKMLSICEIKKDPNDLEKLPNDLAIKILLENIVGLSKLCSYITELTEHTFILIIGNIQSGQFLDQNLIFIAAISRIWVLVKGILVKLFSWYEFVRKYSLQYQDSKYYKMFMGLPECLSKWIGVDLASLKVANKKASKKLKQDTLGKMFGSMQDSTMSDLDSVMEKELSNKEELNSAMEVCSEMDLGEPMSVEDTGAAITRKKKKKKKTKQNNENSNDDVNIEEVGDKVQLKEEPNVLFVHEESQHLNESIKSERMDKVKKKKRKKMYEDSRDEFQEKNVVKNLLYQELDNLDAKDENTISTTVDKILKKKKRKKKSLVSEDNDIHTEDNSKDIESRVNNLDQNIETTVDEPEVDYKDAESTNKNKVGKHARKIKKKNKSYGDDVIIVEDKGGRIKDDVANEQKRTKSLHDDADVATLSSFQNEEIKTKDIKKKRKKEKTLLPETQCKFSPTKGNVNFEKEKIIMYEYVDESEAKNPNLQETNTDDMETNVVTKKKRKKKKSLLSKMQVEFNPTKENTTTKGNANDEKKKKYEDGDEYGVKNPDIQKANTDDMETNLKKKKRKKKKSLLYGDVESCKPDVKDEVDNVKTEIMNKDCDSEGIDLCLMEVRKKSKKAKRKKDTLVDSDLETSQQWLGNTVDQSVQSTNAKKQKMKHVEDKEIPSMECKMKKNKNGNDMDDAEGSKCKKQKLQDSKSFLSDHDELDDIFSCLE